MRHLSPVGALVVPSNSTPSRLRAKPTAHVCGPTIAGSLGRAVAALAILLLPAAAIGQSSTYHLHQEAGIPSTFGQKRLTTNPPDFASVTYAMPLKNAPSGSNYAVQYFDTLDGTPGVGTLPAGTIVTFSFWMRKTANWGTLHPSGQLYRNPQSGQPPLICGVGATGFGQPATPQLTTTFTKYTMSCTVPSAVTFGASDRFEVGAHVWIATGPGNHTVSAELKVEGTLNGTSNSTVVLPNVIGPPPTIASLVPASGNVGSSVTIAGANFQATQGNSTVTFNGVPASVTSWSPTSISATVPSSATSGNVVVTVAGQSSNGKPFTVNVISSLIGRVSRSSNGTGIVGALIQAFRGGTLVNTTVAGANGNYSIPSLVTGIYDVRISASGFADEIRQGTQLTSAVPVTLDVAMLVPGSIAGKVTEMDGITPIPGASISVIAGARTLRSTNSNASGDYTVTSLRPGSYKIQAMAIGHSTTETTVVVAETATAAGNISLGASTPGSVEYAYDAAGRLIQVTDASNQTAIYRYDAVGNLIAIERAQPNVVAISGFSPANGISGTNVTISGTGFSTGVALNSVTLNGVAAPVVDATTTALVVQIPAGAASGTFTVTTPTGSAVSIATFTVTSGSPVITGFSPSIWTGSGSLTIDGTNFDTLPTNNVVRFNVTGLSSASTSTGTTMTVPVPPTVTSGHLRITTPMGSAISAGDFIVPPPGHSAANIQSAGRVSVGGSIPVSLPVAGKFALVLFDHAPGARTSITITDRTIAAIDVVVWDPSQAAVSFSSSNVENFHEPIVSNSAGSYAIRVLANSTATGSLTLNLHDAANVIGAIAADGSTQNLTISAPGQNAVLTFNGTASQRVSLKMTPTLPWPQCANFDIQMPALNDALLTQSGCVTNTGFLEPITLPGAGAYRVVVNPFGAATGSVSVSLYDVPADLTGTVTVNGATAQANITAPGQNAEMTFSGTQAQNVSIPITAPAGTCVAAKLLRQDGVTVLATTNVCSGSGVMPTTTLPATESYRVHLDPVSYAIGTFTLAVLTP